MVFSRYYNSILPKLVVALVTPTIDNEVDSESLKKLLNFQFANHVAGIFLLGTTGEFNTLPLITKKNLLDVFYKIITDKNRQVSVFIGISAKKPEETLELIRYCSDKKFPITALVVTPLFGEGAPEEKLNLVLQNTSLPIMLYNNPAIQNGINLPLEFVEKFSKYPQIIGIKDSSENPTYFSSLLSLADDSFHVYQGGENNLVNDLKNPLVSGAISGTANLTPLDFYNLVNGIEPESSQENILNAKRQLKEFPNYIVGIKQILHVILSEMRHSK